MQWPLGNAGSPFRVQRSRRESFPGHEWPTASRLAQFQLTKCSVDGAECGGAMHRDSRLEPRLDFGAAVLHHWPSEITHVATSSAILRRRAKKVGARSHFWPAIYIPEKQQRRPWPPSKVNQISCSTSPCVARFAGFCPLHVLAELGLKHREPSKYSHHSESSPPSVKFGSSWRAIRRSESPTLNVS